MPDKKHIYWLNDRLIESALVRPRIQKAVVAKETKSSYILSDGKVLRKSTRYREYFDNEASARAAVIAWYEKKVQFYESGLAQARELMRAEIAEPKPIHDYDECA